MHVQCSIFDHGKRRLLRSFESGKRSRTSSTTTLTMTTRVGVVFDEASSSYCVEVTYQECFLSKKTCTVDVIETRSCSSLLPPSNSSHTQRNHVDLPTIRSILRFCRGIIGRKLTHKSGYIRKSLTTRSYR